MGFLHALSCGMCGSQDFHDNDDSSGEHHEKEHWFHRRSHSRSHSRNSPVRRVPTEIDTNPRLGDFQIRDSDVAVTRSDTSFTDSRLPRMATSHTAESHLRGPSNTFYPDESSQTQTSTRAESENPSMSGQTPTAKAQHDIHPHPERNASIVPSLQTDEVAAHSEADRPSNLPLVLDGTLSPAFV